jgi:hypothetical protein
MLLLLRREFAFPFLVDRRRQVETIFESESNRRLHQFVYPLGGPVLGNPLELGYLCHQLVLDGAEPAGVSLGREQSDLPEAIGRRVGRRRSCEAPRGAGDVLPVEDLEQGSEPLGPCIPVRCRLIQDDVIYVLSFRQGIGNDFDTIVIDDVEVRLYVFKQVQSLQSTAMQNMKPPVRQDVE